MPPCLATATHEEIATGQYHKVTLSVIVESLKQDSLTETTALSVEATTAELAASRILFTFGEPNGLVQPSLATDDGLVSYTPVLRIDDQSFAGASVLLPRLKSSEGPQDVTGGFADVLGSDFYGGPTESAIPGDDVMSAWLQVDLESPDGASVSARSEIFDRLGMAIRLKGSDSGFELLPLAEVDGEYVATSSFWQVGLLLGELKSWWTTLDTSIELSTVDGLSAILDSVLRAFPSVRREVGGGPASPIILMLGVMPSMREGDDLTMKVVLDALHVNSEVARDVESVSREAVATPIAEYLLTSSVGAVPDELGDIIHVMRSARESSIPLIALKKDSTHRVEGASATALARMEARLKGGQILLVPARSAISPSGTAQTAWWYMDPELAVLRDEHENGRHMAAAEYTAKEKMKKPGMMSSIKRIGCAIAVPFFIAISATNYANPSKDAANVVRAFRSGGNEAEKRRKLQEALRVACSREKSIRNVPPGPTP
jgi:hypothetical protein